MSRYVVTREVEYEHAGSAMIGSLLATADAGRRPTVLLLHDAWGLSDWLLGRAEWLASLGYTVFAADLWGDRALPSGEEQIGPLIGALVGERDRWMGRVAAAHAAAAAQPEVAGDAVVALGFCFGGSSALEYLGTGAGLRGAVALHPGLDLLADGSPANPVADASVLVCVGSEDPMATPEQRDALATSLTATGTDWQLHLYGGAVHAFTNPAGADSPAPHVVAYDPRAATRAFAATEVFLAEVLGEPNTH